MNDERMEVLLEAAKDAAEVYDLPTVLRYAPTHTGAALLMALERRGWSLQKIPTGTAPQRPKADPLTNDIPLRRSEKWPAPAPQTEGEAILNRHQDKAVKESAIYKAMTEGECPDCAGDGRWGKPYDDVCPTCSGTGKGGEK